ncbi:MAG: tetratricopeptide repeat protein [Synergistaceae bacterium]|nr:tetratricopeptide repeat protein [Synergistaceae bacterium]
MTQDLFDWLNSTHTGNDDNVSGTGGLLLVPVNNALPMSPEHEDVTSSQESTPEPETLQPDASAQAGTAEEPESEAPAPCENVSVNDTYAAESAARSAHDSPSLPPANPSPERITAFTDAWQGEAYIYADDEPSPEPEEVIDESSPAEDTYTEPEEVPDESSQPDEQDIPDEEHESILNQAWHEAAGFHLNLDEPPPQMWTDIDQDSEEDDDPKDYEENPSLQGDAYIPVVKHGANFTQRLQATLKGRKDRAAKQHENDENPNSHPYVQKALIFCGVLLMALGFAYFGLWFIRRETPDRLSERARTLYEQGKFDEAANLYQRGYRRNPEILTFLTGLARSSEKAGHTQTAIAAWNEYMSSLPKDDTEHRRAAQDELDRLIPGGGTQPQPKTITLPQPTTQPKPETPPRPAERPSLPDVRPMTFDEALSEGNSAFNIGMFSRAIANFHKAHAIRPDDIRPYVGLAASYRAKGMYFDAKRIISEARKKFGRDPALEIESYYLRRE